MKAALIPPKGLEARMYQGSLIMGLAHLVRSPSYLRSLQAAVQDNRFVILDNGAAEGEPVSNEGLQEAARLIGAKEVVLPDVMRDAQGTVDAATRYLKELGPAVGVEYMAVAQGTTFDEVKKYIDQFKLYGPIATIGLPRLLVDYNRSMRIDLANWMLSEFGKRYNIHFLGTNPAWPREVYYAARYAPHVRSVDTSMPYNYALAKVKLDTTGPLPKVTRPQGYFEKDHAGMVSMNLIEANEDIFKRWTSPVNLDE